MTWGFDKARGIARVKLVSDSGTAVHIEFLNGNTMVCTSDEVTDLSIGEVVLVEDNMMERAPLELWPGPTPWVGIVKFTMPSEAVVEISGTLRIMRYPSNLHLRVGNTVRGFNLETIESLISEDPIRFIDLPEIDDQTIGQFKRPLDREYAFEEFAGSPQVMDRARELIETPLKYHSELTEIGAHPIKGVLFTGPPGTGKTMLARIIASQAGAEFYQVSGPQVVSKWLGQSEELIRRIFDDAARQKRAIIFFDEIDSLAAQRSDESHEASRRVVGQLLASMDGFKPNTNVVVIATSNRPQDIEEALLRPGRFDWVIDFSLPSEQGRKSVLEATQPPGTAPNLPHDLIAAKTEAWSPADLKAIWSEAALLAVTDSRKKILTEDYMGGFERVAGQRERKNAEKMRARRNRGFQGA